MAQIEQVRILFLDASLVGSLDRLQDFPGDLERSNLEPEQNFSPEVVPDAVEVLLVEHDFADGPVETRVSEVGQHVLTERLKMTNLN